MPQLDPIDLWHSIIDGEAAFHQQHGKPPKLLRLPVLQAYDLAKLGKDEWPYADLVMKEGIKGLEKVKIYGIKVKIVTGQNTFSFE